MDPTQWNVPFPVIVAALFVIVCCRAGGTYWLGRLASEGARRTRLARLMESPRYQHATTRVNEYGAPIVAVSFLTIGFQTLANLAAGASRMPLARYLPALAVGGVMWALMYATIGVVGVDVIGRLYDFSPPLAIVILAAVIGGYIWFVVRQARRHARQTADDTTAD